MDNPKFYLAIVLIAPILAMMIGLYIGRAMRMREHGWKIGLILATIAMGAAVTYFYWPPKLGIDLSGGVILIYEVDEQSTAMEARKGAEDAKETPSVEEHVDIRALVEALQRRINPSGVKEVVIREYGDKQVEIIIPEVTDAEIRQIKQVITQAGYLKFRILANSQDHRHLRSLAEAALNSEDPNVRTATQVRDSNNEIVGEWVRYDPKKVKVEPDGMTRQVRSGLPEVLMVVDAFHNVEGKHLSAVRTGFDETARPCVNFNLNARGAKLFGSLTGDNLPDKQSGLHRRLGIVMDEQLMSAPNIMSMISDSGRIEGDFSQEEVDTLVNVLRAGRLPAVLHKTPISESNISPLLGLDTIRKGSIAIGISLIAVLVFMLVYYRFSGVIACMALMTNLLLIVAIMILISAGFTLPGLAGLVLTVGMSVDANVLVFERVREELSRGAALRMAIRNGFARATTTIVDANVTTLITAVVLYVFGRDQMRGFAVPLILGIAMSMYTAIFCSRVTFDVAERKRWVSRLKMMSFVGETHVDFIGKRGLAAMFSMCLIVLGVAGVILRGEKIFDIDFLGGTSVQAVLKSPLPIGEVRQMVSGLADDVSVTEITPENYPRGSVYKIDTSLPEVDELHAKVASAFTRDGESLLKTHSMDFEPPTAAESSPKPSADDTAEPKSDEPAATAPTGTNSPTGSESTDAVERQYRSRTDISFDEKINAATLREIVRKAAEELNLTPPNVDLFNPAWQGENEAGFDKWQVKFTSAPAETGQVLQRMQREFEETPVWLSSSKIGGKVALDAKSFALTAIGLSLIGIVAYIWVRFQHVVFGLAAVVALVHDVLITLGAVATSVWLAHVFGFLLIEEFKISLPVLAAILTIIGYSLNDTIVVFDRIREVRGKSPQLTAEMINASINQTLSRTLLTSLTTLIVIVILYVFGGEGIHGFAFALLVGVVVGTYSSIFIASPVLLWMTSRSQKKAAPAVAERVPVASR